MGSSNIFINQFYGIRQLVEPGWLAWTWNLNLELELLRDLIISFGDLAVDSSSANLLGSRDM